MIGGGLIGVEVANTLFDLGNKVTIVEMLEEFTCYMEMVTRKLNLIKLQKYNVPIYTNSKITRIKDLTLYQIKTNGEETEIKLENIDIFVVATGMKPNKKLIEKLKDKILTFVIGNTDKVGDAVSAIQSAYFLAKEI